MFKYFMNMKKNIVNKYCDDEKKKRALIQVSYSIGIPEPLSVSVFSYGSGEMSDDELLQIIQKNFDLRPGAIIRDLDLCKPIFKATSVCGHFKPGFTWEVPKKLEF